MLDFIGGIDFLKNVLASYVVLLPRIVGLFLMIPLLSPPLIPRLVRNGIIIALMTLMVPLTIDDVARYSVTDLYFILILFKEAFLGVVVGFMLGIFFFAVQSAGFFIDNQRGASIASTTDPLLGHQTSPLGIFFSQLIVVYFFSSGLFLIFLGALYRSYLLWPVFSYFPSLTFDQFPYFLKQVDLIFYLTLMFAGPVIIAMFVAELGLALISRFAPQLNVFFLSMPIKSGVAFFILYIYMEFLFFYVRDGAESINTIFKQLDAVFK